MHQARLLTPDIEYAADPDGCAAEANAFVIITEGNASRALDLDRAHLAMKTPILVDLGNIYDPEIVRRLGFTYTCIGRPSEIAVELAKHRMVVD